MKSGSSANPGVIGCSGRVRTPASSDHARPVEPAGSTGAIGGLLVQLLGPIHALRQIALSSVGEGQASSSRTSEAVSEEVVSAPLPSMTASKSARLDSFSAITFSSIVSFATRR